MKTTHDILNELGLKKEQIVILSVAGSHMYGMDTPKSDMDFLGVYLPTRDQLLLNDFPKQVSLPKDSGLDLQIWSIHYFLKLACHGETMAIDLLHSPIQYWLESNNIWIDLINNRKKFFTKNMKAFVSYARKQAAKYGLKGERLKVIEDTFNFLKEQEDQQAKIRTIWDQLPEGDHIHFLHTKPFNMYQICGKKFQDTVRIDYMAYQLKKELTNYGERARLAKENKGVDWKAISHALRTTEQVYDILKFGDYEYPLKNSKFYTQVKMGKWDFTTVVQQVLDDNVNDVEKLIDKSTLPEKVDKKYWDKWLIKQIEGYVL